MVTLRERVLSPKSGTAGREHRNHLAQSIKASYRHHLLKPRAWELGSLAFNLNGCFWWKHVPRPVLTGLRRQGGGCESLESTALWPPGWSSSPAATWKPRCSTALSHVLPDHASLEISNLFQLESEHPFRNQGGNSLWLIIPNIKTSDKILKYKTQKIKTKTRTTTTKNLFGYSVDHIKGHGQGPFSPNPHTQLLYLSQRSQVSHLAEVHLTRLTAWLPVLQLQ